MSERSHDLPPGFLSELRNSCGISFATDHLPMVLYLDMHPLDRTIPDTLFSEYLLYKFLGFVSTSFETYVDFYRERASVRAGHYDPRLRTVYLHPHVDQFWTDQILAHELAHVWFDDVLRETESGLPLSITDGPDRYLAIAAVSEGFAHACQSQYATERIVAGRGVPSSEKGRPAKDTMPLDNQSLDLQHPLAPFFERASGWTYSIGRAYVQDRLRAGEPESIVALPHRQDLPRSTSELMGYRADPAARQLGGLLTREALVWSGIAWENADAISASVFLDELEIEAGGPSDEWCVTLSVELGEMEQVPPRYLDGREAFLRWAALTGNELVEESDHRMTFRRCASSANADVETLDSEQQARGMRMEQLASDGFSVSPSGATRATLVHNYSPLPYASAIPWRPNNVELKTRGDAGRLIPPSAHYGTDIDSMIAEVVRLPALRTHVGDILDSLLRQPDRLVQLGERELAADAWKQELRDAQTGLVSIAREHGIGVGSS